MKLWMSGAMAIALVSCAHPPAIAPPPAALPEGLVGEFHPAPVDNRGPIILTLGGSEGGLDGANDLAKEFNAEGFSVLALAYLKAPGLPKELTSIPLETFDRAIAWLSNRPGRPRVIVVGGSKGAEAALLAASRNERVCAVIAGLPSSVAWPSSSATAFTQPSWTSGGAPTPFLPYALTSFAKGGIYALYNDALPTLPQHPDAIIPVEKIKGPVLLISGKADKFWPSAAMGDQIMARLDRAKAPYQRLHLSYENAGHAAFGKPAAPGVAIPPAMIAAAGGTAEGNQAARLDGWPKTLAFLHQAATTNCR